jgi:hypothetical protein
MFLRRHMNDQLPKIPCFTKSRSSGLQLNYRRFLAMRVLLLIACGLGLPAGGEVSSVSRVEIGARLALDWRHCQTC